MPLFGKRNAARPSEEDVRAAQVDLERIRQGGIPLGAEERLKRVASTSDPFFTSDLTAKEYALAESVGLQPIAQVMGSSVVQHGWTGYAGYGQFNQQSFERPWNLARDRAIDRLRQEATLAGADGVIGVEISVRGNLGEADTVEFVAIGTAVRHRVLKRRDGAPLRLCALSGQDVDKLSRIGAEVVGIVGHTSAVVAELGYANNWVMSGSGIFNTPRNVEITEISYGVDAARRDAIRRIESQSRTVGANQIVVSALQHSIRHHEYEQNNYKQHYFIVILHILATAIRLGAHEPYPTLLPDPKLTINLGH